jgi:cell division control protein 45
MRIQLSDLYEIYNQMRQDSLEKGSILIFVGGDVDGIAACRILTFLLHKDAVQYCIIPVANYTELETEISDISDPNIHNIILLNCGGAADFTDIISSKNLICYIFDSQRPYLPENVRSEFVRVVDETYIDDPMLHSDEELEIGRKLGRELVRAEKRSKNEPDSSGVYFGLSTAGIVYDLACKLNRSNSDMLWLWIVGLTDQLLYKKIDRTDYEERISICINEVVSNPQNIYRNPINRIDNEDLDIESDQNTIGSIQIEHKDLRIILYRHWSLYDSLYYSNYIASRLGIWKEPGKRKLNEILAQIGIPLLECKQQYKFMKASFKSTLKEKLSVIGTDYDIEDMFLTTCVRQYTRKTQYSASDVVYSVSALIECPGLLNESENIPDMAIKDKWLSNFWVAHDALLCDEILQQGITLAIEQQKAIIQQGSALIDKKAINPTNEFRYSIIPSDSLTQTKFFHHPLALKKLTCFIMEAYIDLKKGTKPKPMVLCIYNSNRNTYFVSGVISQLQQKNDFGWRFHEAAEVAQAEFRRDFFEDTYIEIKKEHFPAFLEQLTAAGL